MPRRLCCFFTTGGFGMQDAGPPSQRQSGLWVALALPWPPSPAAAAHAAVAAAVLMRYGAVATYTGLFFCFWLARAAVCSLR